MRDTTESHRNGCALHGAVRTAASIGGVVPIIHSNSGCLAQNYLADRSCGVGGGCTSGFAIPGTNVVEKQVIFGGGSRLREQIKNTIKVMDGSLYIVLSGCESAMVGDDAPGMVKEAAEQGQPVVCSQTAGFSGDSHYGYSRVMWDLIDGVRGLAKRPGDGRQVPKDGKTVNLFGILPGTDIFSKGDISETARILEGVGLKVNAFLGPWGGTEDLASAPDADLSIIFSKWGAFAGDRLEEKYGVPQIVFPALPAGPKQVRDVVRAVAEKLGFGEDAFIEAEEFLKKEERYFRYFLDATKDYCAEAAGKPIAIVGDESALVRIGSFLRDYLGAEVADAVITDPFVEPGCKTPSPLDDIAGRVHRSQDLFEIGKILKQSSAEMILGSSLEAPSAGILNVPLLEISYPASGHILNRTYSGIRGAVQLAEDYMSKVIEGFDLKERAFAREIDSGARRL